MMMSFPRTATTISGEEVLWGALDYLAGGDIPDVSMIAHKLDVGNAAVLAAVVDSIAGVR